MVAASCCHTVLLRSDGSAVACGRNDEGQCDIPPLLKGGLTYTQVSAGGYHTVLLRSDGSAVACGENRYGQCDIPSLLSWREWLARRSPKFRYTQVAAGGMHTVLLRSDGSAVACGSNSLGQCDIPPLGDGVTYAQVAGNAHTVLLRSDGSAVACGYNENRQCDIPPLDDGLTYTQVSAGGIHTVLLRSDGSAVACGFYIDGRCDIPPLKGGLTYTQVSAGDFHTVLLRSDGSAVACGRNRDGQCEIPLLHDGVTYTQVSAGYWHTVLLRSDGSAVACGENRYGQCDIPSLLSWREWLARRSPKLGYVPDFKVMTRKPDRILQLDFLHEGDAMILRCVGLDGEEVVRLKTRGSDLAVDALRQLTRKRKLCQEKHRVVLPDGQLLEAVCSADPSVTLATVHLEHGKP
eukprot:Skav211211  [mRNA]  locus=scaffold934:85694:86911:- [translate_table: standard]